MSIRTVIFCIVITKILLKVALKIMIVSQPNHGYIVSKQNHGCPSVEANLCRLCIICIYLYCRKRSNYQRLRVVGTRFSSVIFLYILNPEPGFPTPYVVVFFVFNCLRSEVIVRWEVVVRWEVIVRGDCE
jgi:hypothetical protein